MCVTLPQKTETVKQEALCCRWRRKVVHKGKKSDLILFPTKIGETPTADIRCWNTFDFLYI